MRERPWRYRREPFLQTTSTEIVNRAVAHRAGPRRDDAPEDATDRWGSDVDVQAHYRHTDPELVEGGQLLALHVPAKVGDDQHDD